MSDKKENKCPDCNCPKCPETKCPPQITMQDIIKAVMPGKSPFYTFSEFHMNGKNVDQDLTISANDRWEIDKEVPSTIQPYNPAAQGIMPYSNSIQDKYTPKLDSEEDMFNLESALDYGLDKRLLDMLKFPDTVKNAYSDRGQNSTNKETIDE